MTTSACATSPSLLPSWPPGWRRRAARRAATTLSDFDFPGLSITRRERNSESALLEHTDLVELWPRTRLKNASFVLPRTDSSKFLRAKQPFTLATPSRSPSPGFVGNLQRAGDAPEVIRPRCKASTLAIITWKFQIFFKNGFFLRGDASKESPLFSRNLLENIEHKTPFWLKPLFAQSY